jgi:hypothetical protein
VINKIRRSILRRAGAKVLDRKQTTFTESARLTVPSQKSWRKNCGAKKLAQKLWRKKIGAKIVAQKICHKKLWRKIQTVG